MSQQEYPFYLSTQKQKYHEILQNELYAQQADNSMQEEESKDEDSYQNNQTQQSCTAIEIQMKFDQDQPDMQQQQIMKEYQTQNFNRDFFQQNRHHQSFKEGNSRDKNQFNMFSNSFDESAQSFDHALNRPQRNCKSSTRMMNKTQIQRQAINPNMPIPIIQNISVNGGGPAGTGSNGVLTASSLNRKQAAFNNYMRSKQQMQNQYQQQILNQMQRANTQNSIDIRQAKCSATAGGDIQDLSNRSLIQPHGGQVIMNNSFYNLQQYLYGTQGNAAQSGTPHTATGVGGNNNHLFQSVILSAGSQLNPRNGQAMLNQSTMDPYTYLRWKQQKYKSCRSIHANNNTGKQFHKTLNQQTSNSNNLFQQRKGNQTQKHNNKSVCSSNGSTTMTVPVKSLSEVKNPQYFIQFRFADRKVTDLTGISQFKNLSELDISGNQLTQEIVELKQLTFLKKLNLSNNGIQEMFNLPQSLEILNISYNQLKKLRPEVLQQLKNLTTIDISHNGLESIDGIQNLKRLKRLLSKSNQVTDLEPLQDIETLIEIDLENNPVDTYQKVINGISNKKDILVVNLRLSPVMLTIQSHDQLVQEIQNFQGQNQQQSILDIFKKKLKVYNNGCLYRSKRTYLKIRAMQQHSKRSSSNFSNGSSSCGRAAGGNTGGRTAGGGGTTTGANLNINNSTSNAFSPLLNNMMSTPNQCGQHITQRLEDIEQIYDEILDEEEGLERKINKIQKKKQKKNGVFDAAAHQDDDDSVYDYGDESLYEEEMDEDDIQQQMSFEEDIDDLQSFRQNANNQTEFLNESTADFKKEIKQINQELREQIGNDMSENTNDQSQSLNSTQTLNTNQGKKNPISFKLDLSKCRQQSQDEEEEHLEGAEELHDPEGGQLEIPGLQFVKVTDDSFRQFQKQASNLNSKRNSLIKTAEPSNKSTLRDYQTQQPVTLTTQAPQQQQKPTQQKQIFIPKLQLGILQQNQNSKIQANIPLKLSAAQQHIESSKIQQSAHLPTAPIKVPPTIATLRNEEPAKQQPDLCSSQQCTLVREELRLLRAKYDQEQAQKSEKIKLLTEIINDIKEMFNFSEDIKNLALFIKSYQDKQNQNNQVEVNRIQKLFDDLSVKYNELDSWKQSQELNDHSSELLLRCEENEKTISQLKEQIQYLDKYSSSNEAMRLDLEFPLTSAKVLSTDVKRTFSHQQSQQQPALLNNPSFFYNNTQPQIMMSDPQETSSSEAIHLENMNERCRKKKITCDIRKVKRPQSVVPGQRRSSHGIKINSLLKLDNTAVNNLNLGNIDDPQYSSTTNEYHQDENTSNFENANFSQTMNKKVGHYLQKLKERNSSLQERLNGSFSGSGAQSVLQRASPLNLNMTQQQDTNPYILSPVGTELNKHLLPNTTTNQQNSNLSSFTNTAIKKIPQQKEVVKISSGPDTQIHNEYSERESKNQSKTQRINISRVQYSQLVNQSKIEHSKVQYQIPQLKDMNNDNYQSLSGGVMNQSDIIGNINNSKNYQMGSYRTRQDSSSGTIPNLQKAVTKIAGAQFPIHTTTSSNMQNRQNNNTNIIKQ